MQVVVVSDEIIAITSRNDDAFGKNAGAVYVYDLQGGPPHIIASPNAQEDGLFGYYLTAIDEKTFLIGAPEEDDRAGNAYLFDLQGTLLRSYSAPVRNPSSDFGGRALLSNDTSIFIAAWLDHSMGDHNGVVYQYDRSGQLTGTFVSPRPDSDGCFGRSATLVGSNGIIISDACDASSGEHEAGAAFLFELDGTLLQTFDNPRPRSLDGFGGGVAFAEQRLFIGGRQIDDLETRASTGAAYIFEVDGTLVTRINDPEPAAGNWFGWNASTYVHNGREYFLTSSVQNSGPDHLAGKAYLIDADGNILQEFQSPEPDPIGQFGVSFAQLGDKLLIGETNDNGGYPNGLGAVWVFEPADLGDFDLDGTIDEFDLEILCGDLTTEEITESWDITGDSTVDHQDLTAFLGLAPFLPGDADFDGEVTFADFLDLSSNFGDPDATEWTDGNFNCSGHVDFGDFLLLSGNFGESVTAQVPEPNANAWCVLVFALLARLQGQPRRVSLKVRIEDFRDRPTRIDLRRLCQH